MSEVITCNKPLPVGKFFVCEDFDGNKSICHVIKEVTLEDYLKEEHIEPSPAGFYYLVSFD